MKIRCFSIAFGIVAVAATAAAAALAMPAPARLHEAPVSAEAAGIVLAQSIKERQLDEMPPVDAGRAPPAARTAPPPAPPLRATTRTAPPPADDELGPPAREVPPPPTSTSRTTPQPRAPTRLHEPGPARRAAPPSDEQPPALAAPARRPAPPAYDDPPRRADAPRRAPSTRSAFYSNCTQQCHLSCEASFETCNGDSSPAKPACVKKLESCRIERCSCRIQ